jgi:hypothetical protein
LDKTKKEEKDIITNIYESEKTIKELEDKLSILDLLGLTENKTEDENRTENYDFNESYFSEYNSI